MTLLEVIEVYRGYLRLNGSREQADKFLVDNGVHPVIQKAIQNSFDDKGRKKKSWK